MDDLISRDYLREIVGVMPTGWEYGAAVSDIYDIIMKAPAVDAVPVVHGRWEEHEDCNGDIYYTCSVCDCYWTLIDGTPAENNMRYCPECGAKMDGGAEP